MALLVLGISLLIAPTVAAGLGHCARDAQSATDVLNKKHGEAPVAQGINAAGALVQVWRTADGATWTITIAIPGGPVCVLAQGKDWRAFPWSLPGIGA